MFGTLEALIDVLPIGNLPNSLDVIRTDVLVLQIVSMLPDIDAKKRNETYNDKLSSTKNLTYQ
jgi:hypothetical protein